MSDAELPKGKHEDHLRVVVGSDPRAFGPTAQAADYLADLEVRNARGYVGWGAVIDPTGHADGMHLFPDAVAFLADQLAAVATKARAGRPGSAVVLQHTVGGPKNYKAWRSFTPDAADALAQAFAAMVAEHP